MSETILIKERNNCLRKILWKNTLNLLSLLNTKIHSLKPSQFIRKKDLTFDQMAKIWIMGLTALLVFFSWAVSICDSLQDSVLEDDNNGSFFTVSSFRYPKSQVRPYDTRYIRGTVHQFPFRS